MDDQTNIYRRAAAIVRMMEQGYSASELAEKVGVDRSYLSMIFNGSRKGNSETWNAIASVFNITHDELILDGRGIIYRNTEKIWDKILSRLDKIMETQENQSRRLDLIYQKLGGELSAHK